MQTLITNRRTLMRSSAWTIPAVLLVTAAPAYATSLITTPEPTCVPEGCRRPGEGKNTKDYFVYPGHPDGTEIITVVVDGREATKTNHGWLAAGLPDSRIRRSVIIVLDTDPASTEPLDTHYYEWTGVVEFPVCKHTVTTEIIEVP